MSLAIALQNIAPDYKYRGSLTAETQQAFNTLTDLSGVKPSWGEIQAEIARMHDQAVIDENTAAQEALVKAWEDSVKDELFALIKIVQGGGACPTFENFIDGLPVLTTN